MPRLACPECRTDLGKPELERVVCGGCDRVFERRGGVWRFLTPTRGVRLDPFVRQYRAVREREGRRPSTPEYYQRLPTVAPDDPHAGDWTVRRETYRHLLRHVLADALGSLGVIAAGAIVFITGWSYADPLVALAIAVLVLGSSWTLLRESVAILLEGTPRELDAEAILQALDLHADGRLGPVQRDGRAREGAVVGHSDEGPQ